MPMTLRAARVNAGYTQRTAARALRISEQTLSNYERCISYPDAPLLIDICRLYGVDSIADIDWIAEGPRIATRLSRTPDLQYVTDNPAGQIRGKQ